MAGSSVGTSKLIFLPLSAHHYSLVRHLHYSSLITWLTSSSSHFPSTASHFLFGFLFFLLPLRWWFQPYPPAPHTPPHPHLSRWSLTQTGSCNEWRFLLWRHPRFWRYLWLPQAEGRSGQQQAGMREPLSVRKKENSRGIAAAIWLIKVAAITHIRENYCSSSVVVLSTFTWMLYVRRGRILANSNNIAGKKNSLSTSSSAFC